MNFPLNDDLGPRANRDTEFRVYGPREVNGMNCWFVHKILANGFVGPQVGQTCFSKEEVKILVNDLMKGKKVIYFGHNRFEMKKVD